MGLHLIHYLGYPQGTVGQVREAERYLCRKRTNLVADWNSCLMPRDTDRRLLGLWGFKFSAERRRGGSDWMKFILSPKIHSLCTHDTWLGEGREKIPLSVFKGADIYSTCWWYKMVRSRSKMLPSAHIKASCKSTTNQQLFGDNFHASATENVDTLNMKTNQISSATTSEKYQTLNAIPLDIKCWLKM